MKRSVRLLVGATLMLAPLLQQPAAAQPAGVEEGGLQQAQEVFLRAHSRLDTFRGESQFSTWLYAVTRSVTINRGMQARRRRDTIENPHEGPDPVDPALVRAHIKTLW